MLSLFLINSLVKIKTFGDFQGARRLGCMPTERARALKLRDVNLTKEGKSSDSWSQLGQTWPNIIPEHSDRKLILYSLISRHGHLSNTVKNLISFIQYSCNRSGYLNCFSTIFSYYSHTPNFWLSNVLSTEERTVVCSQEVYQRGEPILCFPYPVQVLSAWPWKFPKRLHNWSTTSFCKTQIFTMFPDFFASALSVYTRKIIPVFSV